MEGSWKQIAEINNQADKSPRWVGGFLHSFPFIWGVFQVRQLYGKWISDESVSLASPVRQL